MKNILCIAAFMAGLSCLAQETLRGAAQENLLMCVAVNNWQVEHPESEEARTIAAQFNCLVAENCMKMETVHPAEGVFCFEEGDCLADFAQRNGQKLIGHCLMWHSQVPAWFTRDEQGNEVSAEVLKQRMKTYITTVVGHFKGRVWGWGVVNEVLEDDGRFRESPYYRILGRDFIKLAFQYAHEADPDAELYYNDYSMAIPAKCDAALRLVEDLRKEGCRVDALGFQGHMSMDFPSVEAMERSIERAGAAEVRVNITEWDLSILPNPFDNSADIASNFSYRTENDPYRDGVPAEVRQQWNERVIDMFDMFMRHRDNLGRVTFWGLTDGSSWRNDFPVKGRKDYALFFDRDCKPKSVISWMVERLRAGKE